MLRFTKKSRKRIVRYGLLTANIGLLLGVVLFVAQKPAAEQISRQNALASAESSVANPLDELSSADIAVHVAKVAHLPEAPSVINNADTVNAQMSVAPADDKVIAKPQVVATDSKSYKDIKEHTVAVGETVSSIAEKYGVTSDSIRWTNGLGGNVVAAGKVLTIPPVNGIVYTAKQGDTAESLALRYHANKEAIIAFNDAEVSGLVVGRKILIPDGIQPVTRRALVSSTSFSWGGNAPVYAGYNGYDRGYCTWWAAIRRMQVGKPIPSNLGNASTWKTLSQRAGLSVGTAPAKYAVIWTPPRDYYGHVGFVEEVYPDGSVYVSEMNVRGWNKVSYKTLTAEQAARYWYIY